MHPYAQSPLEVLIEAEELAESLGRVMVACAANGVPWSEEQQLEVFAGGSPVITEAQHQVIQGLELQIN